MNNLFSLKGKIAIITGGAGMLGTEYAVILARAGATVVLFDIAKPDAMKRHVRILRTHTKGVIHGYSVDIASEQGVKEAVARVVKEFKKIDILINNAAMTDTSGKSNRFSPYEDYPLELWQREMDVDLTGSFLCAKAVMPHMMKAKSGVIVNVSSIYGVVGPDNRIYEKGKYRSLAYATAKSGILNFTRALASYLAPYGIRVNTFTPGGVYAGHDKRFADAYAARTMLGRMATKEEYQGPMLFLCSDASSYMTGSNVVVDGGWTAW